MSYNPYLLKALVERQLKLTEIPAYFEWGNGNRIFWNTNHWVVYNSNERLYVGYDFEEALNYLFGTENDRN